MILHLIQTMCRALASRPLLRLTLKRAEVPQQRPTTQTPLTRLQVTVQRPTGVQLPIQPVHRPVHLIARPMALRVAIALSVLLRPTPELLQRLLDRARPRA